MKKSTRVVVVEDSPTQARAIVRMLEAEGDIAVVAMPETAPDAIEAVCSLKPDVVTMDLDIPDGGGHTAIDTIMRRAPTPILVISGLYSDRSAPQAVEALAAGAVEAIPKPERWNSDDAHELRRLVRRVRGVPVIGRRGRRRIARVPAPRLAQRSGAVIGVAASTGGPAAVAELLAAMAEIEAPVLLVQHIHASFAGGFATWLRGASGRSVEIGRDGQKLASGCVYVAPGERHIMLGPNRTLAIREEPVTLHRPSADLLFESLAGQAGPAAIGVVLTGMGADGARGLAALRRAGGVVLAQDQGTSVVYGMPQAALKAGAADEGTPLGELPRAIRAAVEDFQ